jgi:methionyl-tRNA formyltransferase
VAEDSGRTLRIVLFTVFPDIVAIYERVLAERGHRLLALFTAPGPRTRRSDDYRAVMQHARPGLDVVVSNQPARWADLVTAFRPDLLMCFGFNWKLPANVLAVPPLGAVNCFGALLPKGRGNNSMGRAFGNPDPEMGMTYHHMTPELDDGPILSQVAFPLTDDDDIDTIAIQFFEHVPGALHRALERVEAGDPGEPQDEREATYAERFEPEWLYIDWNNPARDVHLQVRSWWGNRRERRGALGEIDGVPTRVVKTQLVPGGEFAPATPGTVLQRDGETLLIQCGDVPLRILHHYRESGLHMATHDDG